MCGQSSVVSEYSSIDRSLNIHYHAASNKSRLRWSGHVERKHDNDWVKRCMTREAEENRQGRRPKNNWWDCVKDDMESLDLSQKVAQFRNKWRRIKWATG